MDTKQWDEQEHAIWKLFPLHPQPQPFESLSSYLIRLLEANHFSSVSHLFPLLGLAPGGHSFFTSCDYRAELAASLTSLTGCKSSRLHATTFLSLGQAFGWISQHDLCKFLDPCLVSFLRYCPVCLSEQSQPYYSLIWRFLVVRGCPRHKCLLHHRCEHCGAQVPLLPHIPRLGLCTHCGKDLRNGSTLPLSEHILQRVLRTYADLEMLLSFEKWEIEGSQRVAIGRGFLLRRESEGYTIEQLVSKWQKSKLLMLTIEQGNLNGKAAFCDYIWYAELLNTSLKEIFEPLLGRFALPEI
jgi:hypothetical protein